MTTQHDETAISTALRVTEEVELRNPCYCEENVWRLAYLRLHDEDVDKNMNYVLFVSNEEKCCPFLFQKASDDPLQPCFWDYHVIFLTVSKADKKILIWDMDSTLPYPCSIEQYINQTFEWYLDLIKEEFREKFEPRFRLILAHHYIQYFYSDRMHMYNRKNDTWNAPPPTYPCILNGIGRISLESSESKDNSNKKDNISNLNEYIDMRIVSSDVSEKYNQEYMAAQKMGIVLTLSFFRDFLNVMKQT